ncbi:TetR/AcrR family transcriptional regulator [Saccharothrix australiensis]|uniref:TetR family transcriptional regulator n=1 Tax=Saccharothrix australiensis TaxID=2072 RepID=A0A495W082_9PSEU|nr:TetR family transcriptional regulator C-terminal domain-containing protein [Saccharothrix australiensis]RKT55101.1 TetR family transcriptional regulator [Saccharothrix australiensis]
MARTIDVEQHERHKADIAGAVWRLVARAGLEAVSLREVAAEAGVSVGRVQHYFRSKDALLLFGLRLARDRMTARIGQRVGGLAGTPEDTLRATLDELLGDDPDTRQAVRVWVAFLGRALDDPEFAELLYADDIDLRARTAEVVRGVRADLDAEREAHLIRALANGLAAELACGRTSSECARAVVHHHLDRVLGGTGRG